MKQSRLRRHYSSPKFGYLLTTSARREEDQGRRTSVSQLTRSLSSLRLTPSRSSGEGWDIQGVVIDKEILEEVLSGHYNDPTLKISKLTISKKQGEKKRKDVKETYELSVRLKRIFGKSKLELVLQMFEENHPECVIYESYVEKLISYLREKYQGGLDYPHTEEALRALARLHAISFCYRRDSDTPDVPGQQVETSQTVPDTAQLLSSHIDKLRENTCCSIFVTKENVNPDRLKNLEKFGVLCHGGGFRESLAFQYTTDNEKKSSSLLGSCVEDCLLLVLTVTDLDTRDSLVSLVHQVYYPAFAKAVAHIDGGIKMFGEEEFKAEVTRLAVHCGLLALKEGFET